MPMARRRDADGGLVPKVYLYPTPLRARSDQSELDATSILKPHGFLVDAAAYGIQGVLAERLRSMPQPPPWEADLFVAFLPPYGPPLTPWTDEDRAAITRLGPDREDYIPNTMRLATQIMCRQLSNSTFMRGMMPHISRKTMRRHVLFIPTGIHGCSYEARLLGTPFPPIQRWVRFITFTADTDNLVSREELASRHVSMPYLSSVRWSLDWKGEQQPPWRDLSSRQHLVCFTGSLRGQPHSIQLRTKLTRQCDAAPDVCVEHVTGNFPVTSPEDASKSQRRNMRMALKLKRKSTFCLEPPGFSPPRKSSIDSLLSGCIPVFFYDDNEFDTLWPFHFGGLHGWGANASVRLPMDAALNRADYDVVQLLRRIPEARVNAMRETIALNAHRLVYGIGQYPGDALETLLVALHATLNARPRAPAALQPYTRSAAIRSTCTRFWSWRCWTGGW